MSLVVSPAGEPWIVARTEGRVVARPLAGPAVDLSEGAWNAAGAVSEPVGFTGRGGARVVWACADMLVCGARLGPTGWEVAGPVAEAGEDLRLGASLLATRRAEGVQVHVHTGDEVWTRLPLLDASRADAVLAAVDGEPMVAWMDDGRVQVAACRNARWEVLRPVAEAPTAVEATLAVWSWGHPDERTDHVAYLGDDGRIHELWARGGKWQHVALSPEGVRAVGRPFGLVDGDRSRQRVLFRGSDGLLHHLEYALSDREWRHEALHGLPAAEGDPVAASGPEGTTWVAFRDGARWVLAAHVDGRWEVRGRM